MKKSIIIILFVMLITSTNVQATPFSNFLPGGKNYFEPDNFEFNSPTLSNNDPIKVKPNTTYTFSMPGEDLIDLVEITFYSFSETYFTGSLSSLSECSSDEVYAECTFTTSNDEYLNIEIEGRDLELYIVNLGYDLFQIEEGNQRTTFEEYIVPLTDSTIPEFSGAGAYIMAYYESTTIEEIISNHILVLDDIDGDVTSSIEIVSDEFTPNNHIVGEHLVVLSAQDSSGNTAYFNLSVIIKDEVVPSISGPNSITVSVDDTRSIDELILSNYTANDGYDGDLQLSVILDDFSDNRDNLGNYLVTLSTSDLSSNTTTKQIEFIVIDDTSPILSNGTSVDVYLSNPQTINEVITQLGVTDNYDNYDSLVFGADNNTFLGTNATVGTYQFDLVVIDSSNNILNSEITVNVIDDIVPTIQGPNIYTISYAEEFDMNDILGLLTISDNIDLLTLDDLVIITDTYSSRTEEIGNFTVAFELTDYSNNKSTLTITINVVDDVSPIIYIDNYLVTLSGNVVFTEQDALLMLVNNRELPNENFSITTIVNEYQGNENIPGTYQYSLQFTNDQGSSFQKDFMIKVPKEVESINPWLIARNVLFYGLTISIFAYTFHKSKK